MNGAGVRSSVRFNILNTDTTWLRCRTPVDCPYAKLSLVCGVLGLIFFGILSVPALVLGLFARDQILNYHNNYKGAWIALTGIFTGALGIAIWGIFFLLES